MEALRLTQDPADQRRFVLEGVGTLRLLGLISRRTAVAEAGAHRWQILSTGFWPPVIRATDAAAGTVVGEYKVRRLRRGGALRWAGREFGLRPDSSRSGRHVLVEGDRRLATIEGEGWGKRPVDMGADASALADPGLLLFATFVVRALAQRTDGAAVT
ncbi:MAG: hypothetical protein H0T43_08525 [Solirubrobacterales bacterium]|nr:hypothetical protein [Solirubrobacterales bacterium]